MLSRVFLSQVGKSVLDVERQEIDEEDGHGESHRLPLDQKGIVINQHFHLD